MTFFLEVLPELPKGVLVQVHDIKLPFDYPAKLRERWYSEQYMLAMYLLSVPNPGIVLPNYHIWSEQQLRDRVQDVCGSGGSSFWFET